MKIATRLIPKLQRYVVYEIGRQERLTAPKSKGEFRFEQVSADNVSAISSFRNKQVVRVFRRYVSEGDVGIYAFFGNEAVGHAWAAVWHGSDRSVWGYMPVTTDTACIYFCSVSPQFRGRNLYQHMLVKLAELVFRSTPVHRILIDSSADNLPSLSAIQRVGFRRLLVLPVLRWCGHTLRLARIPKHKPHHPSVPNHGRNH